MPYSKITSRSNPKIKEALDVRKRRGRYRHLSFIIEGAHLIEMALRAGGGIDRVFFTNAFGSIKDGQKLLGQVSGRTDEIFEVPEQLLNEIADTETPQGIIAIASYRQKGLDELKFRDNPLIVVADGIQEPGNLGTIIRTSDAAGADAVIILKGACDAFSQKTIRATAGSIFNIPVVCAEKEKLFNWLKEERINLIATALDSEESIFAVDLKKPVALVFGNEARGISNEIKKNADLILKIPIFGKAESLNVAASAAVCLYEAVRQRTSP